MAYKKLTLLYFSPAGTTMDCGRNVAEGLDFFDTASIDLMKWYQKRKPLSFCANEVVILAFPVYYGRLPQPAAAIFECLRGQQTPCILLAVYGNNRYGDALAEMMDLSKKAGLVPIGAAALLAQHSLYGAIASGRPDKKDRQEAQDFGKSMKEALKEGPKPLFSVPGAVPTGEVKSVLLGPIGDEKCISCGICAEICPTKAIDEKNPKETSADKCILCTACIHHCPTGARAIRDASFQEMLQNLAERTRAPKKNEFFINHS